MNVFSSWNIPTLITMVIYSWIYCLHQLHQVKFLVSANLLGNKLIYDSDSKSIKIRYYPMQWYAHIRHIYRQDTGKSASHTWRILFSDVTVYRQQRIRKNPQNWIHIRDVSRKYLFLIPHSSYFRYLRILATSLVYHVHRFTTDARRMFTDISFMQMWELNGWCNSSLH